MVKNKLNHPITLLLLLVHAGAIVGLILLSGDLGVALVYFGIILFMLWCAGLSSWYFLGMIVAAGISLPILWSLLKPYQQERIIYGFSPEGGPLDVVRQPLMSLDAVSQGGLFGKGLFSGGVYEDLAASHTDFIFATVCEKFGFVGGFAVVACLCVLAVRLLWLAVRCSDNVGRLMCAGISAVVIFQTLENLWMCIAKVPVIGITLPFMSAGGSSVLAMYLMIGFAHSIYAKEKKYYFKRQATI
jgi:rod shape determining protein RodA